METTVQRLEETGDYRILRRLKPRPVLANWSCDDRRPGQKIGIILDTETTGLDHRQHEIIELGMVMFTYTDDGIQDVVGVFDELREPSEPISPEISRITGITDAMVKGRSIDPDAVADFVAPADLIIAHNARFDRPFCENFAPGFDLSGMGLLEPGGGLAWVWLRGFQAGLPRWSVRPLPQWPPGGRRLPCPSGGSCVPKRRERLRVRAPHRFGWQKALPNLRRT